MNKDGKFKIWAKGTWMKVKENLPRILFWTGAGVIIGGATTALRDSKRITKLENRMDQNVKIQHTNVDKINDFIKETDDSIDELIRQNNILMEKALLQTEGKAS